MNATGHGPLASVSVSGRCAVAGEEFTCKARFTNAPLVLISCAHCVTPDQVGLSVIAYLDDIGPVAGVIERTAPTGFLMRVTACRARRERIERRLSWLRACRNEGTQRRGERRIVPHRRDTRVRWPDGATSPARILDLSMSGACLVLDPKPAVGWTVTVGKRVARVVRHTEDGIAVAFALPFSPQTFDDHAVP